MKIRGIMCEIINRLFRQDVVNEGLVDRGGSP